MEVMITIVRKLGYNLLKGLTTYLYRGYNPVTKYNGHPSTLLKTDIDRSESRWRNYHSQVRWRIVFGAVIDQD